MEANLKLRGRLGLFAETLSQALQLADQFAHMVRQRCKEAFTDWLQACKSSGIGEFGNSARSLQQDQVAVEAALSMHWSNGTTEGNVNRLKFVKRQMYGRASLRLLRTHVVAAY